MPWSRAVVPLVLFALLALPCHAEDAPADEATAGPPAELPYARIGVVPFFNDSKLRRGGEQFTEILLGRLQQRIPGVEFVLADLAVLELSTGPLQPDEARKLGAQLKVQAFIDGFFSGVDIVGGTWPSLANDIPQAKGSARWRLLDAGTGILLRDGRIDPERPKLYSRRVRDTDQLIRRVMLDLAEEIAAELVQPETDEPEAKPEPERDSKPRDLRKGDTEVGVK